MGSKPSTAKKQLDVEHNEISSSPRSLDKRKTSQLKKQDSVSSKDLMISYSHADNEMMKKIRAKLEENGISVWVDVIGLTAGVDFLSKIGQAILDAKLFLSLLSTSTCKSKYCQDEVALAYISQKAIFPVAINPVDDIYKVMDTGMKLQLSNVDWTIFENPENFDSDFEVLLKKLKSELEAQDKEANLGSNNTKRLKEMENKFKSQKSVDLMSKELVTPDRYWEDLYKDQPCVGWHRFIDDFRNFFAKQIFQTFTEEDMKWLTVNLQAEMENETDKDVVQKYDFIKFCTVDTEIQPLWQRVEQYTKEVYALAEILSMNSSVRVDAIENLGRYQSPAVISALQDLLRNKESNIRAVAAVSLAKTGSNDKATQTKLMKLLSDKDRLVREAGCLALGHLQAKVAVPKLLHLWRNDFISHVREAAKAALDQIGGPEVETAMHITKVLAEEIRMLTEET